MKTASLSINYTPADSSQADPLDLLILEQKEWSGYTGHLTKVKLAMYLRALLAGEDPEEDIVDCGWGDTLDITVYAYRLYPDVIFRLVSTVGELGALREESIIERETISFEMNDNVELNHPAKKIRSARWLTGPYTEGGIKLGHQPELTINGLAIESAMPLYGSVWLEVEVERTMATISISREEAIPLLAVGWSEFCVGLPRGGRPVALELEAPPGAEELAKKNKPCGRGNTVEITGPDEDEITAPKADKLITGDYCTLELDGEAKG